MFGFILNEKQYGARHLSPFNLRRTKRAVKEQIRLLQQARQETPAKTVKSGTRAVKPIQGIS